MGLNSLGIGLSGLRSNLASIETVGHNISNANTEGYSRQRVEQTTRLPNDQGAYIIGQGTAIETVSRIVDTFLGARLRNEQSAYSGFKESSSILNEVEFSFNELSEQGLSAKLSSFFNAIHDFSNNVSDNSTRVALLEQAASLASEFNRLDTAIDDIQGKIDNSIVSDVNNANLFLSKIASINREIVRTESGGFSTAVANDLRDKREVYLKQLSEIMSIDVREEKNGAVYVTSGGQKLVSQSETFPIDTSVLEIDGDTKTVVSYADNTQFNLVGGSLQAFVNMRDVILNGVRGDLDQLAGQFIFEMNKIQANGRGTQGLTSVESDHSVIDSDVPLDVAKLNFEKNQDVFKMKSGSFDIVIENKSDGSKKIFTVNVDLNQGGEETTLNDLIRQMNVAPNLKTELNAQKKLQVTSLSPNIEFYFANDTSNVLAAVGMNSFFTGTNASDISVNNKLRKSPQLISGALSSQEGDNSNAVKFSDLVSKKNFGGNSLTLNEFYQTIVGNVAIETNRTKELVNTHDLILANLTNLREEISGVSIDDEASNLLKFQRSYQASARFVAVVSDLLDTLINRLGV